MKALVFTTGGTHLTTMLGMLEELSDRGRLCEIDSYAGISAGAILAAFCATRPVKTAVKELQDILIHHCKDAIKPHYKFLNMPLSALFKKSLLDDSGLANLLKERLENAPLCATLYVGLTNETDMRYELHRFAPNEKRGSLSLSQAVHASASIPVVLPGEDSAHKHYSDGGVFHQMPVIAIEHMLRQAVEEEQKRLDLTIIASSTWLYRPEQGKGHLPFLAKKTLRFLDCTNYNNLSSDREILREAVSLYEGKVNVSLCMYAVPTALLRTLHERFTMDKLANMSKDDVVKLQELGKNIVRANCATYNIAQDEPCPVMLKY